MLLRVLILVLSVSVAAPVARAEKTLGQALKKIFSTPTPTPHRKKKTGSATSAKKKSPTPTTTPSASPKKKHSPASEESPTGSPSSSPKKKHAPAAEEQTPISSPKKKKTTPTPTASAHHKKKGSPTPEPFETPEGSTPPAPSPEESAPPPPSPSPSPKRGAPNATLLPNQIKGFENYPLKVQKLLTSALELTTRNLDYKYGSADPASGGMDCSGFVYYVLKQNEVPDVPRDSSQQYIWLRHELEDLKPGDLLFWTGTYSIERDPPITHAMIYLGREKKTGNRVMVGASDGRVYEGESRFGVSVFDFKIQRRETNGEGKLRPTFIGYAHIPGLQN